MHRDLKKFVIPAVAVLVAVLAWTPRAEAQSTAGCG